MSGEPASAQASRAATTANCSQRSIRRAWTRPTPSAGSTAATSRGSGPADPWPSRFGQLALTPLRPASIPSQVDSTSPPRGAVAPSPVTTRSRERHAAPPALLPTNDTSVDRGEVLQLVVGDLDAELVLGGDGDLHHRQRVDVQVVDEALARRDVVRGHAGDLLDDFAGPGKNLLVVMAVPPCLKCSYCSVAPRFPGYGTQLRAQRTTCPA